MIIIFLMRDCKYTLLYNGKGGTPIEWEKIHHSTLLLFNDCWTSFLWAFWFFLSMILIQGPWNQSNDKWYCLSNWGNLRRILSMTIPGNGPQMPKCYRGCLGLVSSSCISQCYWPMFVLWYPGSVTPWDFKSRVAILQEAGCSQCMWHCQPSSLH